MPKSLSIVIPAFNSAGHLRSCLEALRTEADSRREVIVVDDGSTDETRAVAAEFPVTLITSSERRGPAFARNLGAKAASGEILVFLDSDVCVHHDTIERIRGSFEADPELDALLGSYDSSPRSEDFLSQYRNLMHYHVHQKGAQEASTFWSGCGAIRRTLFLEHNGFDEAFGRPAIEDIELGYRLSRAGRKIELDRTLQVTHLKRWTFWGLVKADVCDRGIPWTELILRDRFMPNDLNLQLSQRVSVALVFILLGLSGFTALKWGGYVLAPLFVMVFVLLVRWWMEFSEPSRPKAALFVLLGVIAAIVFLAYSYRMYGLIPPLMLSPALLLLRHRYAYGGLGEKLKRWLGLTYIGCSIAAALHYLPSHGVILFSFTMLAALGVANSSFYLFLAGKRGILFMLATIPFHLLYHFYNGVSFMAGILLYLRGHVESQGAVARQQRVDS
ncbi:MAG TPA: glycosyltransferase family 2 protein [Bryobacteraceae bacterium]|jgi:glycosyltransferase involved in cell wall biosynthesis